MAKIIRPTEKEVEEAFEEVLGEFQRACVEDGGQLDTILDSLNREDPAIMRDFLKKIRSENPSSDK